MMNDVDIWVERLSSLHKSRMRKAASAEGLQLVHLEIMNYLSICNKYSNTAQALSEYLGQTKGSISQSLKFLEESGHIGRKEDETDRRVARLSLTAEGIKCLKRMNADMPDSFPDGESVAEALRKILSVWQSREGLKSFGLCRSCRYNLSSERGRFQCGLTGDPLTKLDVAKLCREHEFEN